MRAIKGGHFDRSLVPVYKEDGSLALDHEEFPRPQTTLEGLAGLKPSFAPMAEVAINGDGLTLAGLIREVYPNLKIEHVHHAGNSSGVVDGAGAILLASPEYAKAHGMKPRARVVAMANMGDSPTLMLNAPVPAARKVLAKAGLTLEDIDLFEINEAFAVVAEKFIRDLKLDREKVNVNGGAMALGHPIGATGSMLIGTMLDELLERRDLKRGLITMCAGGGMAPAIIIERKSKLHARPSAWAPDFAGMGGAPRSSAPLDSDSPGWSLCSSRHCSGWVFDIVEVEKIQGQCAGSLTRADAPGAVDKR